jgi:hypothetical protein
MVFTSNGPLIYRWEAITANPYVVRCELPPKESIYRLVLINNNLDEELWGSGCFTMNASDCLSHSRFLCNGERTLRN